MCRDNRGICRKTTGIGRDTTGIGRGDRGIGTQTKGIGRDARNSLETSYIDRETKGLFTGRPNKIKSAADQYALVA